MATSDDARNLLDFLQLAERLKSELRHSWVSCGRQESVAEHSWQMALLALLAHRHLEQPVDLLRTLKMILIHDLVEAEAGDIPAFETGARRDGKAEAERQAITNIRSRLDPETGQELFDLFFEFEAGESPEAKLAIALDNLEVQIQHNLASFESWEPIEYGLVYTKMDRHCEHDRFLRRLCTEVKADAEEKMRQAGIDVEAIKTDATGERES